MGDNQDRAEISPITLDNDADGYTVSLWLKQSVSNENGIVIGDAGAGNLIWKNKARYFFKANGGLQYYDLVGDTEWHHLVFVNNAGDGSTLYVDNVAHAADLDQPFTFDRLGAGYIRWGLVGHLDEVWVFDHALTAEEVANLYHLNKTAASE